MQKAAAKPLIRDSYWEFVTLVTLTTTAILVATFLFLNPIQGLSFNFL